MSVKTLLRRMLALSIGLVAAATLGEAMLRTLVGPPRPIGVPYFRDVDGTRFDVDAASAEAVRRGLFQSLPPEQTPRPRFRFAPGSRFFICYDDAPALHADWLDDRGCVEVRINRFGLRERESITPDNKAAGERRILCLGDSFTFGWGVPEERCWVRMLEDDLRTTHGDVRTVNCGLSGTLTVDECWRGLETRFGVFRPDVVIVSIYLNDLIPSHGLCIIDQPAPSGLLLYDYLRLCAGRDPLDLDPEVDWVARALSVPEQAGLEWGVYGPDKPFAGMWSQGAPQRALVAMRDWARDHNCVLMTVLWPFLQGLGPAAHYPFTRLHDMVTAFCEEQGIAALDLLPSLAREPMASLWVTPFDKHANPHAQQLVLPAIAAFVRAHLPVH